MEASLGRGLFMDANAAEGVGMHLEVFKHIV